MYSLKNADSELTARIVSAAMNAKFVGSGGKGQVEKGRHNTLDIKHVYAIGNEALEVIYDANK